jgi:hypothetical protein
MYVLLCGAETQGVGFTRREYEAFLNRARKDYGDVGIDPWVQRRMWSLIKAVMFATKSPHIGEALTVHGDQGRSAFALLQDIVYRQYLAGRWNDGLALAMSQALGSRFVSSMTVESGAAATGVLVDNCRNYMHLDGGLLVATRKWQGTLEEDFCTVGTAAPGQPCRWRATPSAAALKKLTDYRAKVGLKGVVFLKGPLGKKLAAAVIGAEKREVDAARARKAAVATTAVVTSAFALWLGRRVAGARA